MTSDSIKLTWRTLETLLKLLKNRKKFHDNFEVNYLFENENMTQIQTTVMISSCLTKSKGFYTLINIAETESRWSDERKPKGDNCSQLAYENQHMYQSFRYSSLPGTRNWELFLCPKIFFAFQLLAYRCIFCKVTIIF